MALIHRATLRPTKAELLARWLPSRPWAAEAGGAEPVAAYRFDDPAGQVGVETILLRASDGGVLQVPLTYRGAALPGADDSLVGTTEHSVLGTRWVYDGCADPVWFSCLTTAVLTGGAQAEELVDVDGTLVPRPTSATVRGTGTSQTGTVPDAHRAALPSWHDDGQVSVVRSGGVEVHLVRVLGAVPAGKHLLLGRWDGGGEQTLAAVRP